MVDNYCVYDTNNLANNEMVCFGIFNLGSGDCGCSSNTKNYIEDFLNPRLKEAGLIPLNLYELHYSESAVPNGHYKKIDSSDLIFYVNWLIEEKNKSPEKPKIKAFFNR